MWSIGGLTSQSGILKAPYPLLLDFWPTTMAAFSYRRLRDGYTGYAVRIRRSSDNSELDVGFSGNNFDSATASSFIGGGSGFIVTWYDQSGNGYDATQPTAANQPTYTASAINGKPGHTYTRASNLFLYTAVQGIAFSDTTLSTSAVATRDSTPSDQIRLATLLTGAQNPGNRDFNAATSGIPLCQSTFGTNSFGGFRASTTLSEQTPVVGTAYRLMGIFDSANYTSYLSGTSGTATASTGTFGADIGNGTGVQLIMGAGWNDTAYIGFWDGKCSEMIWWGADQTANFSGIDSNISAYYGV